MLEPVLWRRLSENLKNLDLHVHAHVVYQINCSFRCFSHIPTIICTDPILPSLHQIQATSWRWSQSTPPLHLFHCIGWVLGRSKCKPAHLIIRLKRNREMLTHTVYIKVQPKVKFQKPVDSICRVHARCTRCTRVHVTHRLKFTLCLVCLIFKNCTTDVAFIKPFNFVKLFLKYHYN